MVIVQNGTRKQKKNKKKNGKTIYLDYWEDLMDVIDTEKKHSYNVKNNI